MPYGPHAAGDRERMLEALGIPDVEALFDDIPEALRASRLDLPEPQPELELAARLQALAARNRTDLASFLGAGVYRHWTPPAVDQLLLRGEWYTAYTPYQPEISQGTLQSIYEYESLIGELMDLDVVSASHYDGAAATAEAALMTCRATRRERVLVSRAVHPHYRQTVAAYFGGGLEVEEIPVVSDGESAGTTDLAALERLLADSDRPVAGVFAGQPNFFGLLEPMTGIGRLARHGIRCDTDNDSEVAARLVAARMAEGADLADGLRTVLKEMDGFFTLLVTTRTQFAVIRDSFACKPAVIAETPDYVAMASEYHALAGLPGITGARVFEPMPEEIHVWTR